MKHSLTVPLTALVKKSIPRSRLDRLLLEFPPLYSLVRYESQLTDGQLAVLKSLVRPDLPGNIIECGAYRGGTTVLLARHLRELGLGKTIYALDSFQGFADEIEDEIARGLVIAAGRTAFTNNSQDYVRRKIERLGVADLIRLVPGFFEDTLHTIEDTFCLAFIDCDLEKSIEVCIAHLWPHVVPGGALVIDDYSNPGYPGAHLAADRWLEQAQYAAADVRHGFMVVTK